MIRSLPALFNYPPPRDWSGTERDSTDLFALSWAADVCGERPLSLERWRGFCLVTQALSDVPSHKGTEICIKGAELSTGLNANIFSHRSPEYDCFADILARPGFRRLDLSLAIGYDQQERSDPLGSGLLRQAIAGATELESLSLALEGDPRRFVDEDEDELDESVCVSLDAVFPPLRKLKYLRLWNLCTPARDLVAFLSQLPLTLQRVDLVCHRFLGADGEDHHGFLEAMRARRVWWGRERRPRLRMVMGFTFWRDRTKMLWLETEVGEYLYGEGRNPYVPCSEVVVSPMGVIRDTVDESFGVSYGCCLEKRRVIERDFAA